MKGIDRPGHAGAAALRRSRPAHAFLLVSRDHWRQNEPLTRRMKLTAAGQDVRRSLWAVLGGKRQIAGR
jgi:hypothetical protein